MTSRKWGRSFSYSRLVFPDNAEVPFHVVHLTLKQSRKSDNLMAGLDSKQWLQFNYEIYQGKALFILPYDCQFL